MGSRYMLYLIYGVTAACLLVFGCMAFNGGDSAAALNQQTNETHALDTDSANQQPLVSDASGQQ